VMAGTDGAPIAGGDAASQALFRTTAACAVSAINLTRTRLPSEDAPVHVEACLHDFFADAAHLRVTP
jgi:hypothetical protein